MTQKSSVTTRRSAGLPSILVAILASDSTGHLLTRLIDDMRKLCDGISIAHCNDYMTELPQVHALNALKAVFSTPVLVDRTKPYIVEFLDVAASSLGSPM